MNTIRGRTPTVYKCSFQEDREVDDYSSKQKITDYAYRWASARQGSTLGHYVTLRSFSAISFAGSITFDRLEIRELAL